MRINRSILEADAPIGVGGLPKRQGLHNEDATSSPILYRQRRPRYTETAEVSRNGTSAELIAHGLMVRNVSHDNRNGA